MLLFGNDTFVVVYVHISSKWTKGPIRAGVRSKRRGGAEAGCRIYTWRVGVFERGFTWLDHALLPVAFTAKRPGRGCVRGSVVPHRPRPAPPAPRRQPPPGAATTKTVSTVCSEAVVGGWRKRIEDSGASAAGKFRPATPRYGLCFRMATRRSAARLGGHCGAQCTEDATACHGAAGRTLQSCTEGRLF